MSVFTRSLFTPGAGMCPQLGILKIVGQQHRNTSLLLISEMPASMKGLAGAWALKVCFGLVSLINPII
jgi:hypothetical protein